MKIQDYNVKGVKSVFLPEIQKWQFVEYNFKDLIKNHNYKEIKLSLIEKQVLFKKTLGVDSSIINREMFYFKDKNGQNLTLIPEGTASCVKELILCDMIRNFQKVNVWYISPMFRRENPQKGRNRQFYQIGLESFGFKDYEKEIEHIFIFKKLFKKLNIYDILLEINCIDNTKNSLFKKILFAFFNAHISNYSSLKTIVSNPLILLEKLKDFSKLKLPYQLNYLDHVLKKKFIYFLYNLKKIGIYFIFNNFLVRGLDYYNGIVYEWTTLVENRILAICSGGRYDGLSKIIGKYDAYGTGCALGIDRLVLKMSCKIQVLNLTKFFVSTEQPFYINIKFFDYLNEKSGKMLEFNDFSNNFNKKIKNLKKNGNDFLFINKKFIKNEIL